MRVYFSTVKEKEGLFLGGCLSLYGEDISVRAAPPWRATDKYTAFPRYKCTAPGGTNWGSITHDMA
ncbi:hypothetical protein J6590_026111 [Homalodisca vitripennis]|nr:hypothetical protein J6590_026111 [Homalodisca vitripennis]